MRIEFHNEAVPSGLLTSDQRGSGPSKEIEYVHVRLCAILDLIFKKWNGLHGWMFGIPYWPIKFQHGGLLSVRFPTVRSAFFPSIKAWFMFPLIILPAHNKRVFYPDQRLPHFPVCCLASKQKFVYRSACVPNIKCSTWFHCLVCCGKCCCEHAAESFRG